MAYHITELHLYPIKSLGGIALQEAKLSETGFKYDRAWMLVDEQNKFITQRECPELTLFKTELTNEGIAVHYNGNSIEITAAMPSQQHLIKTSVFRDSVIGQLERNELNQWFSEQLNQTVRLIRTTPEHPRFVENHPESIVNFSDSNQYLILGESAMQELNEKLEVPLRINRFRGNIIFKGGQAHDEDEWGRIQIGERIFEGTKRCGRCKITTIEQETAQLGKEPLATLKGYRAFGRKVCFGYYFKLVEGLGKSIRVGDEIRVL